MTNRHLLICLLTISLLACKKEKLTINDPIINDSPNLLPRQIPHGALYVKGQINDKSYELNNGIENVDVIMGKTISRFKPSGWSHRWIGFNSEHNQQSSSVKFEIHFINTFRDSVSTCEEVKSIFHLGKYNFINDIDDDNGVYIEYRDKDGIEWSTIDFMGGKESIGMLEIQKHNICDAKMNAFLVKVKFNCTFYNKGQSLILNGGEMLTRSIICNQYL